MYVKKKKTFKWQINASAVGKLLGHFGRQQQQTALAETWLMNLKRMPRFGVVPAEMPAEEPTVHVVESQLEKPIFRELIQQGIESSHKQQEIKETITKVAKQEVIVSKRKFEEAERQVEEAQTINTLRNYPSRKSGIKRAAIGSYFTSKTKLYQKTSRKTARLATEDEARQDGYQPEVQKRKVVVIAKKRKVEAQQQMKVAQTVSKHVEKTVTKVINTTRGCRREASDLQLVQQRFPNVVPSNDRAYFMHVSSSPYSAFVIGKVDGLAPGLIFELKHRQAKLFNDVRGYEQVQCILYMKMLKIPHLMLIETYQGKQNDCELKMDANDQCHYRTPDSDWQRGLHFIDIKRGLEKVVHLLNTAEIDEQYRNILKKELYN